MSDFSDPDFNEGWFTVGRAPKPPSPASPSGNRHDGIHDYRCGGDCHGCGGGGLPGAVCPLCLNDGVCPGCARGDAVAYPVDIDAARTAVIEAASAVCECDDDNRAFWMKRLRGARANLDALTTKGAST